MTRAGRTRIEFVILATIALGVLGGLPIVPTNAWSDDELGQQPAVDPTDSPRGIAPDKDTPREIERKQKAYAGLAALAGIAIVGVSLGALTILWGGRLRREFRRPTPDGGATGSEFWFLKPPKPPVGHSSLPDSHQPPHVPPPTEPS